MFITSRLVQSIIQNLHAIKGLGVDLITKAAPKISLQEPNSVVYQNY